MKWLQGLLAEVDKVTVLTDSDSAIESGQTVLGELPMELKKLFSYCMMLATKTSELRKEVKETDSRKAAQEIEAMVKRLEKRLAVASVIMWEEIKFEFKDHCRPDSALAVCKGWTVCSSEKCDCPTCKALGGLLGLK